MFRLTPALLFFTCLLASFSNLASQPVQQDILLHNVYVFDGSSDQRSKEPMQVLLRNGLIEQVTVDPITVPMDAEVHTIDGQGRTLMPGLIDAHWHSTLVSPSSVSAMTADIAYIHLLAGKVADATLMRGFTSVRDMGGPSFGLRRAIEEGLIAGPRIFPSGAMVSQTGGHGDFRLPHEIP